MGEGSSIEGSRRALLIKVEILTKKAIAQEELSLPEDPNELEDFGLVIDESIRMAKVTLGQVQDKPLYVEQWERVLRALSDLKERYETRDMKDSG